MSKNAKLRRAAIELPPFPKFTADNKIMRDRWGRIQYVDHFKVISKIRREGKGDQHLIDKAVMEYMKKVRTYDKFRKKKTRKTKIKLITIAIITGLAIYFSL